VSGELAEENDSFTIAFDTDSLCMTSELLGADNISKHRFLIACYGLKSISSNYSFDMDPSNLMYDAAFSPKVLVRDAYPENGNDFDNKYKALICAFLSPTYEYGDYYKGGADLVNKNPFLKSIVDAVDAEEVRNLLQKRIQEIEKSIDTGGIHFGRRKYRNLKILGVVLVALIGLLTAFGYKLYFIDMPLQNDRIAMSYMYVDNDYKGVIGMVKNKDVEALDKEERYMAAYSSVKSSALNTSQKDNVLVTLNSDSEEMLLNYWVYMGIGAYDESLDIAKRIGSPDLEVYALLVMQEDVTNDNSISGAKKEEMLKSISEQLSSLQQNVKAVGENETSIEIQPGQ
jgi:type VII secretion protein EssB